MLTIVFIKYTLWFIVHVKILHHESICLELFVQQRVMSAVTVTKCESSTYRAKVFQLNGVAIFLISFFSFHLLFCQQTRDCCQKA